MVSAPLAAVLRNRREDFNARFERARHLFPQLDGEQVFGFVREAIDPVAVAVNAVDPTAVDAVVSAAYDAGLTLVGQKLAGAAGRYPAITDGFKRVFPASAKHLAAAPERVIAALSNALHSLASVGADGQAGSSLDDAQTRRSGARPEEWIAAMTRLAPHCADVESLLQVGQVAAWRAGLAHFRDGALALAAKLPPQLAAIAIGATNPVAAADSLAQGAAVGSASPAARGRRAGAPAPSASAARTSNIADTAALGSGDTVARNLADVLARLSKDIWFDPAAGDRSAPPTLRIAREVGAFRGYGGLFKQPPQIAATAGGWLVRSADDYWFLTADAFGATFHRATAEEWDTANPEVRFPPKTKLSGQTLKQGATSLALPTSGPITSATTSGNTLALTSSHTHTILFVALGSSA
jgi:hypothetical protein